LPIEKWRAKQNSPLRKEGENEKKPAVGIGSTPSIGRSIKDGEKSNQIRTKSNQFDKKGGHGICRKIEKKLGRS